MAETVTGSGAGTAAQGSAGLLPGDVLTIAYLGLTGALSAVIGGTTGLIIALLHAGGIALVYGLSRLAFPRGRVAAFLRLVYPVALTPLLYAELATLNQFLFTGYFDALVQRWELAIFGVQLSIQAGAWWDGLWLSEALHLGYFSYYFLVPATALGVFLWAGVDAFERYVFAVALAFFVCYLAFATFPVAGPRYLFEPISGPRSEGVIFGLVHAVLAGGSSRGTAFPSSHVAAAVTAWLAAGREDRRLLWLAAPFAIVLTLGTVYGRFHYAVDAAAGLAVALAAWAAAPWMVARLRLAFEDGEIGGDAPAT